MLYFNEGEYRPQGGARTYYARDHLGSVRDMLDAEGKNLARYDYDPYGNFIDRPMKAPEFGYAGMRHHAPSGLYLTQYRAYDPRTGRWLSRDPIEEAGGINLYGYVKGNPIAYRDPLGLSPAAGLCTATGPGVFVCVAVVGSLTLGMMIYARIIASRSSSSSSMGGIIEGYDERGQYVSGIQTSAENCPPAQGGATPVDKTDPKALSDAHKAAAGDRTIAGYGGNCSPDEYDQRSQDQAEKCGDHHGGPAGYVTAESLGKCRGGGVMSPSELLTRRNAHLDCAVARDNVARCFAGGDDGHVTAREQALIDSARITIDLDRCLIATSLRPGLQRRSR